MSAVLAFRVAAQGLATREGSTLDVLRGWAVQDSPPGAAAAALAARTETVELDEALAQRSAVAVYNPRTATAILPADEAATFATALLPSGDAELSAILGQALPDRSENLAEPVELAVDAVSDALDGTVLSRDDLHEQLRRRLPGELLPWCEGCQSHHARRGLLVMAGLRGRLCMAGRAGRQPAFARTDQWIGWDPPGREQAGAELVRRFLGGYGPSTPARFAAWAGIANAHARALWALVDDELADAGDRTWVLARDAAALRAPGRARGVRLLAPGDPLLLSRDREALVPDKEVRGRLFRPSGAPGLVLSDGAPGGLWRARKQGRRLSVAVEPIAALDRDAVLEEARRLAPHRGATTAEVDWG